MTMALLDDGIVTTSTACARKLLKSRICFGSDMESINQPISIYVLPILPLNWNGNLLLMFPKHLYYQ